MESLGEPRIMNKRVPRCRGRNGVAFPIRRALSCPGLQCTARRKERTRALAGRRRFPTVRRGSSGGNPRPRNCAPDGPIDGGSAPTWSLSTHGERVHCGQARAALVCGSGDGKGGHHRSPRPCRRGPEKRPVKDETGVRTDGLVPAAARMNRLGRWSDQPGAVTRRQPELRAGRHGAVHGEV